MQRKRSFFERLTGSVSLKEGAANESSAPPTEENGDAGELAVDVYQTPAEIVIKTMVAGVKPEDLELSISRETVAIRGNREPSQEISPEDYFHRELYWGKFARTILLPAEIEVEEAEAIEKHGLLTIRLPKIDKDRTQTLKIKSL